MVLQHVSRTTRGSIFRIQKSVIDSEGFEEALRLSWSKQTHTVGIRRVWDKLKRLKDVVKTVKRNQIGRLSDWKTVRLDCSC